MELSDIAFEFAKKASKIKKVDSIILFGSVARNEQDNRSDIDLFVIFDSVEHVGKIKEASEVSNLALDLEKMYNKNIQLVLTNKFFEKLDEYFLDKVFREGIILYGKQPKAEIKQLKLVPYSIITFSLETCSQSDKMKIKRALYGYETKKTYRGKKYTTSFAGIVKEESAQRTGKGSILISSKKCKKITKTLDIFKVKYKKIDVWIQQP